MNEATALPEGRELELAAADPAHELDGEKRSRLHAMLEQSWARAKAGRWFLPRRSSASSRLSD
jgi:hypothetical protein